jgi:hypothetical protein
MYSALYATDCQEKRLLIVAVNNTESNLGVKNLSYLLPRLYKRGYLAGSRAAEQRTVSHIRPR